MNGASQQAFGAAVRAVIADVLGVQDVAPSAVLRSDLGVDSLTGTYIVARLSLTHHVQVPLPILLESSTVDDFICRAYSQVEP